jgi:hypothetical protein
MKISERRIDYKDDLTRLQNRAGQCVEELIGMVENLGYVEPAHAQLKTLAANFEPAPESHDFIRMNANVQVQDPREELSVFERQLQLTVENLDRAAALLEERRRAIAALLR